ncbi:hypothetical protein HU200_000162 [Digitaria exilis]|uniref:ALOG domain-containing protein n=1 Tax=Digitaria exilis TaxID=1010633 RepID=A0A835G214_9POAL|nr:hypothetical protein HU200_000162 [Digitaria exilis]
MDIAGVVVADSPGGGGGASSARPSRYESQKRRDWQTFGQYLRNHRPPLELTRCSGAHVLEFLRYLDQFGKTKVHAHGCPFYGHPSPPAPCPCPLKQAWGSLDALVGRLRAAFEEHGGPPEANPFGARAVRLYLREVRDSQAKARGIAYEKKRRRRHTPAAKHRQVGAKMEMDVAGERHAAAHGGAPVAGMVVPVTERERRGGGGVGELMMMGDVAPAPHFLIPHGHFVHGQFFMPVTEPVNATGAGGGGGGGGGGDELVLAMAAAAEAHAAASGFFMPLSVFH